MSKPKHSNAKRAVWVIATLVMLAMATALVVVLIEDPPLEAQVEEVMKSHGFKMTLLLAPDSGVLVYTDFRASNMSDANLEQLALKLEELASAEVMTRTRIDSGFSLRYDLEGDGQRRNGLAQRRAHITLAAFARYVAVLTNCHHIVH